MTRERHMEAHASLIVAGEPGLFQAGTPQWYGTRSERANGAARPRPLVVLVEDPTHWLPPVRGRA